MIGSTWELMLNWEKNIKYFIKAKSKYIILKWLHKCPSCYSNNLQFVEGNKRFEKWFCLDCTIMHYSYRCSHCKKKNWVLGAWKTHIYKEYQFGKYRGRKNFYRKNNDKYIKEQISFYKHGLKQWQLKLKEYRAHKDFKLKYGDTK